MGTRGRVVLGAVAMCGAVLVIAPGAALAQDGEIDQPLECGDVSGGVVALTADEVALAAELEAALTDLAADVGLDGGIPDLIGERGRDDLPPGEAFLLAEKTAACAADQPDGGGSSLTGPCVGIAISFDGSGAEIDAAADLSPDGPPIDLRGGGQAFTAANPFEVDVDGYVLYLGTAGPPEGGPENHDWFVDTMGVSIDSGGDPNGQRENAAAGSVNLRDDFPAKVNALFRLSGEMQADDGFLCQGAGYFKTTGGTPIGLIAGAVMTAVAIGFGALFNTRPAVTFQSSIGAQGAS